MPDDDSDFDEVAHEKLIKAVSNLGGKAGKKKPDSLRKTVKKVNAKELVSAISSTRNLNDVKKELQKKKKMVMKTSNLNESNTLSAPMHRLAHERIQSSVAYREVRKDLNTWAPVVQEYRLADQIIFPLEKDKLSMLTGTERLQSFKPRTPLELEMARCLGLSKNNLANEEMYTEAEKELLKAMSLKEAKLKCAQLQKMRALTSYREAKLKRQAKIKSKSYRRRLKQQKRKQLIKEFDELLVKDPEAAKEKLAEIERQRILERATLKHRNGSKRIQQLARHAARDPEAKKLLEDQIRLGRELMGKHSVGNDDTDSDSSSISEAKQPLKAEHILEKVAELAARETAGSSSLPLLADRSLTADLEALRKEKAVNSKQSAARAFSALSGKVGLPQKLTETNVETSKEYDEDAAETEKHKKDIGASDDNARETADGSEQFACKPPRKTKVKSNQSASGEEGSSQKPEEAVEKKSERSSAADKTEIAHYEEETIQSESSCLDNTKSQQIASKPVKKRKVRNEESSLKKAKQKRSSLKAVTIDGLFDDVENRLISAASQEAPRPHSLGSTAGSPVHAGISVTDESNVDKAPVSAKGKKRTSSNVKEDANEVDISMDPKHFLHIETSSLTQVPASLMESIENFDAEAEREAIIAEAFEDDDVIASFEEEKATAEESEKARDIDLTLQGWGSWTGPGICENKKDRFVLKAKEKPRKDKGRNGLIISESVDSSVEKLQPKAVPFPYTTVEDYEAVVRQPLGKEWNTQGMFRNLTKPAVITKMGRIIKPLDKEAVMKEKMKDASDDDE